jgi:hypothetical protein
MTVTNNIYQKQINYHVFNAVTNSELTELVPVFTILFSGVTSLPLTTSRPSLGSENQFKMANVSPPQ